MLDLSDLSDQVPLHLGQVRNFYLLVLGQVKRKSRQFCISYLVYNERTCCVENSVDDQKPAALDLHCL